MSLLILHDAEHVEMFVTLASLRKENERLRALLEEASLPLYDRPLHEGLASRIEAVLHPAGRGDAP